MIAVVDPHMPRTRAATGRSRSVTKPRHLVDPLPPGAVAARTNCSQKIVEALLRALSSAVPTGYRPAATPRSRPAPSAARPRHRQRFVFTDIQAAAMGAGPMPTAAHGQDSHLPRL